MKYKHHTLLPVNAFQGRGSVVGGRSLRLHGGDSSGDGIDWVAIWEAEQAAEQDRMARQAAEWQASQGRMRLLEEYNRAKAAEEAAMRAAAAKAEQDAINARNAYAAEQYRLEAARMQQEAERLAEQQRQQAAAYQAQQEAAAAAERQRQAAAAEQQRQAAIAEQQRQAAIAEQQRQQAAAVPKGFSIQEVTSGGGDAGTTTTYFLADPNGNPIMEVDPVTDDYGNPTSYRTKGFGEGGGGSLDLDYLTRGYAAAQAKPFGAGTGQALGYAYGLKNSGGDLYKKFDAQGNLTEFLDQHGQWQKASDVKPVGAQINQSTGQFDTVYSYGNRTDITGDWVPGMSKYREDQGGWLGEGGWQNLGMLALTGLTAGLASAGVGAGLAGGVAGANAAESAAALTALLEGGSTLGNALQIGNQLVNIGTTAYDFLKDSNPQAAQVIEQLQAETKKNESAGMPRDQAIETAMTSIATTTSPPPPPAAAGSNDAMLADLNQRITTYENAGLSRDAATDQAIKDLSTRIGTTESTLLSTLNTTKSDLLQNISGIKNSLQAQINANELSGMTRDAATDKAIKDVAARLGTTEAALLSNLNTTKTDLQRDLQITKLELNANILGVKTDLQTRIEANERAGLSRSQATDKAIKDLATSLNMTEQNLLDSIAETKTDLINEIGDVKTQLSGVQTSILDQMARNEAAGMSRDQALNSAIVSVSKQLGKTEQTLLAELGMTKTELSNQISTGIQDVRKDLSGVETNILTKIAEYELRGMTRDQALQRAIGDVSTQLGKTEQNLLDELGLTKTQLSSQISNVETNLGSQLDQTEKDLLAAIGKTETTLGGQITGVGTQVTDLTKDFTDFSTWSKETEEKRRRKQEGDEALGMLTQMASGSVKSGVPAEIDYFYDIGGESLFATPKQESLLPSPYEQQPEAVEGAQPKYQYYDPSGGYLFANGGMIDEYADEDLYRILGSR